MDGKVTKNESTSTAENKLEVSCLPSLDTNFSALPKKLDVPTLADLLSSLPSDSTAFLKLHDESWVMPWIHQDFYKTLPIYDPVSAQLNKMFTHSITILYADAVKHWEGLSTERVEKINQSLQYELTFMLRQIKISSLLLTIKQTNIDLNESDAEKIIFVDSLAEAKANFILRAERFKQILDKNEKEGILTNEEALPCREIAKALETIILQINNYCNHINEEKKCWQRSKKEEELPKALTPQSLKDLRCLLRIELEEVCSLESLIDNMSELDGTERAYIHDLSMEFIALSEVTFDKVEDILREQRNVHLNNPGTRTARLKAFESQTSKHINDTLTDIENILQIVQKTDIHPENFNKIRGSLTNYYKLLILYKDANDAFIRRITP